MEYEMYRYIYIGFAILSAAMLVLAIIIYFKLKIPKAIADLSGRTRRKALREKQEYGAEYSCLVSGEIKPDVTTARITPSGNLINNSLRKSSTKPLNATTILASQTTQEDDYFEIEYDITFIHTNETII